VIFRYNVILWIFSFLSGCKIGTEWAGRKSLRHIAMSNTNEETLPECVRFQEALDLYNSGVISTQTDAATAAEMPRPTFFHRVHGRRSAEEYNKGHQLLNSAEEGVLVWYCDILQRTGFPLSVKDFTVLAAKILRKREQQFLFLLGAAMLSFGCRDDDACPVFDLATLYIGNRIGEATAYATLKGAQQLYDLLMHQTETETSAGRIFKRCHVFSKVPELSRLLRKQPGSQGIGPDIISDYFPPQPHNLCSVGSFGITRSTVSHELLLVLFLMTVSTSHPVNVRGLASVWAEIPAFLRKTSHILVFVDSVDPAKMVSRQTVTLAVSNPSVTATITPKFAEWDWYVLAVSAESV